MESTKGVYFGIDINSKCAVASIYKPNMEEPATISTVLGTENYTIPTCISKKYGMSQWYFGDEAIKRAKTKEAILVEDLYNMAVRDASILLEDTSYAAKDLLTVFFKKLFSFPGATVALEQIERLVVCVEQVSYETMELMTYITMKLGIDAKRLMLIDKQESFYHYALSQKPELFLYDVALFDFSGQNLVSTILKRNQNVHPQVIKLDVINHGAFADNRDLIFDDIISKTFGNNLISSVYLVGDGFDGDWMKTSLTHLCRGRKVFLGKNLYSKGACYAGFIKDGGRDWPFIYIGDNDLKLNLSIRIYDDNELKFYTLIDAGQSWYDVKGECEVILDGSPEIEFYIQRPDSREAHIEVLELTDLPERENRTTRLRIIASPQSDKSVDITIMDLGFGEISPSSSKTWEHTISLKN